MRCFTFAAHLAPAVGGSRRAQPELQVSAALGAANGRVRPALQHARGTADSSAFSGEELESAKTEVLTALKAIGS